MALKPEFIAYLAEAGSTEEEFRSLSLPDRTAVLTNFKKLGKNCFFYSWLDIGLIRICLFRWQYSGNR